MAHPFTFGSFKIKSDDQIETLKKLGLKQIRYSPTKSDVQPLEIPSVELIIHQEESGAAKVEMAPDPILQAMLDAKRERLKQHERRQTQLDACEKAFGQAAKVVRNINAQIYTQPKETVTAADHLVGQMLDSLLSDSDIAIHLMNGKSSEDAYFHSLNVSVLALMLGREMKLSREQIHVLGLASLFHDIGKSEVPDRILLKTEGLNRAEQSILEQHCQWSVEAGHRAGLDVSVLKVIAQHHEMCDGSGYPHKLNIDKIDPLARILALVNIYDNFCNKINPAQSLTPHEGLALMFAHQKAKFDPVPLNHFIKCLGVYPPGTLVMLSNECYGLVVSVNASRPLKPQVLVFDKENSPNEAMVLDLEFEKGLNITKSIKLAQLPRDAALYLSPKKRMTYFFSPSEST
jgi:putative nucleotidyltransferase with HDIG domain